MIGKQATIYTDGSCIGNPGPGGWAAVILCNGKQIELSGGASDTTNNRMELMGLIQGLKALDKDTTGVKIYSDSQYVVRAFNDGWLKSWKRNGWKRKEGPVKNLDLWKELDKLTAQRKCTFIWVKGHNGNQYNELCDQMACAESAKYADGCDEEDDRPADILFSVDDILAALDEVLKEAQKREHGVETPCGGMELCDYCRSDDGQFLCAKAFVRRREFLSNGMDSE